MKLLLTGMLNWYALFLWHALFLWYQDLSPTHLWLRDQFGGMCYDTETLAHIGTI